MRTTSITLLLLFTLSGFLSSVQAQQGIGTVYIPLVQASGGTNTPSAPGMMLPLSELGEKLPVGGAKTFFKHQLVNSTNNLSLWVPPNAPVVRGIFFQNGAPIGPNPGDPDWRNGVAQSRELAARQLASLWGFAYLSGANWTDANRSSYDAQEKLLQDALNEFAAATGHPELRDAPIAYMGASRFAAFGPRYAQRHPERMIAYVLVVSGNTAVAPGVPGLMLVGEQDNGATQISGSFVQGRGQGALLAPALMWGTGHICDRCGDLAWPFLDQVIRMRLPADRSLPLKAIDEQSGWLGNITDWNTVAPYNQYNGDKQAAAWFPNQMTAQLWRAFMLKIPAATLSYPTQPYSWSNGFTQEPAPFFGRKPRELNARTPFTITATLSQPQSGEIRVYDGETDLGAGTLSADGKKLTLPNVTLSQGMHSFTVRKAGQTLAWPAGVMLLP